MSYIDFIEKAAGRAADALHDAKTRSKIEPSIHDAQEQIENIWICLERNAKDEHYEVLEASTNLRAFCNALCAWLYSIPGSHPLDDCKMLRIKDAEYGGSWQRRGGPGAFFAACRKWDRYEESVRRHGSLEAALANDKRQEGILDDVGDLRRYLILWEAWRLAKEAQHLAIG